MVHVYMFHISLNLYVYIHMLWKHHLGPEFDPKRNFPTFAHPQPGPPSWGCFFVSSGTRGYSHQGHPNMFINCSSIRLCSNTGNILSTGQFVSQQQHHAAAKITRLKFPAKHGSMGVYLWPCGGACQLVVLMVHTKLP